jgi:hypothetical protein
MAAALISDTGCTTIAFVSNTKSGDERGAKQVIEDMDTSGMNIAFRAIGRFRVIYTWIVVKDFSWDFSGNRSFLNFYLRS